MSKVQNSELEGLNPGGQPIKAEESDKKRSQIFATVIVCLWFLCAVTLSNALKWLFKTLAFKYPIFITFGHMVFSNLAACIYLVFNCRVISKHALFVSLV